MKMYSNEAKGERFPNMVSRISFITDINNPAASAEAQSEIPYLWNLNSAIVAEYNHIPGGSKVLYLDGHVGYTRFPGDFPVTRAFAVLTSAF